MSLDDFFGNSETKLSKFKNVFYFDNENYKASWLDKVPSNCNFKKKVNWREYKLEITLCGTLCEDLDKYKSTNINKNKIPLLKSHLQKNIRRNQTLKAIMSGKEFLDIDFCEFVRRLSIIMVEDCVLHESFNVLTWMVSAYGSWQPNIHDITYCLSIIDYLSQIKERDYRDKSEFNMKAVIKKVNKLDETNRSLIYSLNFRKSYGGLNGDILMLGYFCNKWLDRFIYNNDNNNDNNDNNKDYILSKLFTNLVINPYITDKIEYLEKKEYDLYAVDFHNNPSMINKLNSKYPTYSKEDIKESIWLNRSSTTIKTYLESQYNEINIESKFVNIYNRIRGDVDRLSHNYIDSLY